MVADRSQPVALSVVTPVYQAERFIAEFYRRASAAASGLTDDYEIIFVNDGSSDKSLEILRGIQAKDERVTVIDLARNFGQAAALRVALAQARGAFIFPLDDDLEEDPEWVAEFYQRWLQTRVDVVLGVQPTRRGTWLQSCWGNLSYFIVRRILRVDCIPNIVTARLMTRRYLDALLKHPSRHFDISLAGNDIGFARSIVAVTKHARGHTSYSWRKRWRFFEDFVAAGTIAPLRWLPALAAVSFLMTLFSLLCWLDLGAFANGTSLAGRLTITSLWCATTLILTALAILGLYGAKLYEQIKGGPTAVVRSIWRAGLVDPAESAPTPLAEPTSAPMVAS